MPKLPTSNFTLLPDAGEPAAGAARQIHSGAAFTSGDIYQTDLVFNANSDDELIENELTDRALFLRALQEMMKQEGGTAHVESAFRDVADYYIKPERLKDFYYPNLMGSQLLISLHCFKPTDITQKRSTGLGPPETTTKFGFQFGFYTLDAAPLEYATAHYKLDAEPLRLLQRWGGSTKDAQHYLRGFYKMAGMAEHDYIHQLTTTTSQYSDIYLLRRTQQDMRKKHPELGETESHALALHAQVCHRLFGEQENQTDIQKTIGRRRKDAVLRWAGEQFALLADMQDVAIDNASAATITARADIREAVTYLSEIYAHRLFRVISPNDPDLNRAITVNGKETTVAKEAARLALKPVPTYIGEEGKSLHGIEGLHQLCQTFLKDAYVKTHVPQSFCVARGIVQGGKVKEIREQKTPASIVSHIIDSGLPDMKKAWQEREDKRVQKSGEIEL